MHHLKNRVLLIDDDPDFAEIYSTVLEKEGFDVTVSYNGKTGLESALKNKPDLIISEVMTDMLEKLYVLPQFKQTPIILLTSFNKKKDFKWPYGVDELSFPVSEFLDKCIGPKDLANHVKRYIN